MKCVNAAQILPEDLLAEIRRYTNGERLLYIPEFRRKGWGETNGSRSFYRKRNQEMCRLYQAGSTVPELAGTFHLAENTVKKIIYGNQPDLRRRRYEPPT